MGVYRTIFFVGHTVYCHHLHCQDIDSADYGVIGLLTVFVAIANILLDSGFSQALIQKKDVGELEFSTVFFLNLMVGILLYAILYVCSPYIARFYNIPDLQTMHEYFFLLSL